MTPHQNVDDRVRDQAVLYALDAMSPDEASRYAGHLEDCPVCRAEAESQRAAADQLAFLAPEADPRPDLGSRILEAVRSSTRASRKPIEAQPWKQWAPSSDSGELTFVPGAEAEWEPTAVAGIDARRLFVDRTARRVTMLVRMAAGTSYPGHIHGGTEECYVLSGDLRVGSMVMHAGDYQRAEAGTQHPAQSTDRGCMLFLISSLHDEITD